jgi:hypothetical protein
VIAGSRVRYRVPTMSERTAPALAKLDELLPLLRSLPKTAEHERLVGEVEALRRAVAAFHMEAIRFRVYAVDRLLKDSGDPPAIRAAVDELRQVLETAGFHTRSHTAP